MSKGLTINLGDLIAFIEAQKKVTKKTNSQKNVSSVPAKATVVRVTSEVREGESVLILKQPSYSHQMRGFIYHNTKAVCKKAWKWEPKENAHIVPVADTELMLTGLRQCYAGGTLLFGEQVISL